VVFKNMHLSLQTQAQLTLETEASALEMIRLRKRLNQAAGPDGPKIGYNAVIIKALAQALKKHPQVNASVDGEVIKVWREIHVGLAVDLGQGLIVPKVRRAGEKTIPEIQAELDRLITQAKRGQLMPDDLALGTVTVTNLGAWDIDHFTPIVNCPESAILGVGRIVDKPVARDGQVVVEPRLSLSLSFDHRIIDGAPGAAFLKTLKDMVEEPLLML
jgi:pyruvate/2-oxoglutarate dehydrogenase complex dihydrolipoamide acyltransferase (E2) component